jgi:general secretion pathway protein D
VKLNTYNRLFILFALLFSTVILEGQTIAEKKEGIISEGDLSPRMQKFLEEVNKELNEWHKLLENYYSEAYRLYERGAPEQSFKALLVQINSIKDNIRDLENSWRELASTSEDTDGYALWHHPETTVGQLIMDYGSADYVYLMTPDIASLKLSVNSNIPVPRSSWGEMLELILNYNGLGSKVLNPYLRQLYVTKDDRSNLQLITRDRFDLEFVPSYARVCFVLSPQPSEVRRIWYFLDKFTNPNNTTLQMVGRDILIIGQVSEVQELLKIYDFVLANRGDKEYKVLPLSRVEAEEMAKIIGTIFDQLVETTKTTPKPSPSGKGPPIKQNPEPVDPSGGSNGLKVIPLSHIAQAVFLVGTREEIQKAESIIKEVESQVGESRRKTIFWYTTKHSDPNDLADILQRVYELMVQTGTGYEERPPTEVIELPPQPPVVTAAPFATNQPFYNIPTPLAPRPLVPRLYDYGYFLDDTYLVEPNPTRRRWERERENKGNDTRNNFIVDVKTGAIVMVVEVDILPKLKELLKKLDVPKKMVQIEVLLFEKRLNRDNQFGLNLLRTGNAATNTHTTSVQWNNIFPVGASVVHPENAGVFEYLVSRTKTASGIPAYDFAYRFLLSQDDIQINASPSVVAINQTPATIEIAEEISVSTGIFEIPTEGNVTLKDSFARARYGIKIEIIPTIHVREDMNDPEDPVDYVTLETDILFETINPSVDSRPDVTRRHITNQVRIPDQQTVIIGGLRRKNLSDSKESIPYLGEIPGIGKLFSITQLTDSATEMFIFITPKIITEAAEDFDRIRCEEMQRRPGDIPGFLCRLQRAEEAEKNRIFQGYLTMLFGRPPERCIQDCIPRGEYDGR